jgi:hypothetical protein
MSKIELEERSETEVTVARMCAELVRQGVTFEVTREQGAIGGWFWVINFTGGY